MIAVVTSIIPHRRRTKTRAKIRAVIIAAPAIATSDRATIVETMATNRRNRVTEPAHTSKSAVTNTNK